MLEKSRLELDRLIDAVERGDGNGLQEVFAGAKAGRDALINNDNRKE